jgi:hypothetical protein
VIVPILLVVTAVAAWTIFVLLARLSGFSVAWWWPRLGSIPENSRGDLVRDTLAILAVFGALLAAIYAYRKQRLEEAAGHRTDAESLSKRYQEAASQLGHEKAAVRLAGVYAMGRLADDWPEQRQTCVDVLCAYLRMPWTESEDGTNDLGELVVRRSIGSLIALHLKPNERRDHWSDLYLDFKGARLIDLQFSGITCTRRIEFKGARFEGICDLYNVACPDGADFSACRIAGRLNLSLHIAADLDFSEAIIDENAWLDIDTYSIAQRSQLSLERARISGRLELKYAPTSEPQGRISLDYLTVDSSKAVIYIAHLTNGAPVPANSHDPSLGGALWNVVAAGTAFLPEQLKVRVQRSDSDIKLKIR